MSGTTVTLQRDSNQALGIGQYAIDFINNKFGNDISPCVWDTLKLFHTDSVMCAVSALALKCNAPTVLRNEALTYQDPNGAMPFASTTRVAPEKAVVANVSAVREWDSNGTVFGYNEKIQGHQAGEFGHNDFYPVVVAAAQVAKNVDGNDSKGASAALSTEVAILSMRRAMNNFRGPQDITRNPEAIFRFFEQQADGHAPFNIVLSHSGSDFAVAGMHFKLGLYEHQSAGALEGLLALLHANPTVLEAGVEAIHSIKIKAYQPAFGIIGDPAKRNPTTRQSADHSMVYIVATVLRKAMQQLDGPLPTLDDMWCKLMLSPYDFSTEAIHDKTTRELMAKIEFEHGGPSFDSKYPEGIPSSIDITTSDGQTLSSGFVLFPSGHSRNTVASRDRILAAKFDMLGRIALLEKDIEPFIKKLNNIEKMSAEELSSIYTCDILQHAPID